VDYIEVTLDTERGRVDADCARLDDLGVSGLVIEDEQDFLNFLEEGRAYWDYVDDDLLNAFAGRHRIKFYLEADAGADARIAALSAALGVTLKTRAIQEEDWASNWKAYYRPIEIGARFLVLPAWEPVPETERLILRLDPGLIFGTGAHPTTRLCLEQMASLPVDGQDVLDLGCGSGILGIGAMLLGAKSVTGYDIDEKAPAIAQENAALSGIPSEWFCIRQGDVLSGDGRLTGRTFGLVLANIVADVIIALAPGVPNWLAPAGRFVCSGIIEGRQDEVVQALQKAGLTVYSGFSEGDWHGFLCGAENK